MKLYDYERAPSPRRTRIFIAEKGLDIETVQIDLGIGEQLGAKYKSINPRCAVPALQLDDGQVLTENVGIASYLEDLKPEPPLMGKTSLEKARVLEWNWRCEFEGLFAIAEILRNTAPSMSNRAMTGPNNVAQIPELENRGRRRIKYFYEDLNQRLSQQTYVATDEFTLADITALVTVDFSSWVKAKPDEKFTALWKWHNHVSARASYNA